MKENEIRPKAMFDNFLRLSRESGFKMQEHLEEFKDVVCPGCGSDLSETEYVKNGFSIKNCSDCHSLYCSPRPSEKQLEKLYTEGPFAQFLARSFYSKEILDIRRERLFKPKAKNINDLLEERKFLPRSVCDVGAGYGLLLDELSKLWDIEKKCVIELGMEMADICRKKGYDTKTDRVEDIYDWDEMFDFVVSFEVIEHIFDAKIFAEALFRLVKPGGYCLATGPCCDGFDIQMLRSHSNSIFPPHHINFLSRKGFEQLFLKTGFTSVEIITPGKLDVDIVCNMMDKGVDVPNFFRILVERGQEIKEDFQSFIARNGLSSHAWVLAKKT